ncbi:MAG: hypothetical protein ACD_51C00284G0004 [uncultured bacterium]|nr:MAG: hypothetical protein ACD_51C00284G0004 [uncultured bacterium]OGJ48451.1 MAG: hypothetical protein A2244_05510 [Candidatus Peregrinibacteria bacterium RIFOXYA2_FULL_41_18]
MPSPHFICLDIETTGLSPDRDKIIEIGIALVNLQTREVEKTFESFINPGVTLPKFVTNLTGIKDEDLKDAPKLTEIKDKIISFVGDLPIAGHNINFDLEFLNANGFDLKNPRLDSMDIAHIAFPKERSYSLEVLGKKLDIKEYGRHRALKDVTVNIEAIFKLLDIYFSTNNNLDKIADIIKKSEITWKEILLFASKNYKKTLTPQPDKKTPKDISAKITQATDRALIETFETNLIPQNPELRTIISTPELTEENDKSFQLLSPNQYLDRKLFDALLEKPSLTADETTFALKIISLGEKETISRRDLHLSQNTKDLWFDYAHKKFPQEIARKMSASKIITMDHFTLARITLKNEEILKNAHLIIGDIDEFYTNAKKALTVMYFEKRFATSDLPQEVKDKITMLMAYVGMVHEKYAEYYGLKVDSQIESTQEWAKCKDVIGKITDLITNLPESEEKSFLTFLNSSLETEIEITVNQNGEPMMTITPKNIGEILSRKIWRIPAKLSLISSAITFKNENPQGKFLKSILALPIDTTVEIQEKNEPYIETVSDLPNQKAEDFSAKVAHKLTHELPTLEKPVFVLTNSKRAAEQLHHQLALEMKEEGISILAQDISGGLGKIALTYENSPETSVLIGTYDFWRTMKPDVKTLIIFKLPFPPPSSLPFQDYALPSTMLKIKKIAVKAKKIISFDNRAIQYL